MRRAARAETPLQAMEVGFHYWLMTIVCAVLVVCVLSLSILWWLRGRLTAGKPQRGVTTLLALNLRPSRESEGVESVRALVVTAHPDDECMFFAPTILALSAECSCQPFLLCLSKGRCTLCSPSLLLLLSRAGGVTPVIYAVVTALAVNQTSFLLLDCIAKRLLIV